MHPLRRALCLALFCVVSPSAFAAESDSCHGFGALLRDAMRLLPEEHRFPCDAEHLVVVRKVKDFTATLPEPERAKAARTLRDPWVWAFVSRRKFPIYLVHTGQQGQIAERYARGEMPWLRFFMSCVLIHEHSHIANQLGEAAAYRRELECVNGYKAKSQIPAQFSTKDLERSIQNEEDNAPRVAGSSGEREQQAPKREEPLRSEASKDSSQKTKEPLPLGQGLFSVDRPRTRSADRTVNATAQ